ncbi:MAG: hypothetical protein ACFFD1_05815 [Candidatus Thorarchaeota archaeon]
MIHLIGLVFKGGLGIPLYSDPYYQDNDEKSTLIYSLSSAITSFASGVIEGNSKGRSEFISGLYRLIVYDPFIDLIVDTENLDHYVLMALQDVYDNLEISFGKLIEIHRDILYSLGLNRPNASIGFQVTPESRIRIKEIALRTQEFPKSELNIVKQFFEDFIKRSPKNVSILALILADIDGGLLQKSFAKDLYEDPAFTELLLANMVAENPADSISVWVEKPASKSILASLEDFPTKGVLEVFAMLQVGSTLTDFRILARIFCIPELRDEIHQSLHLLCEKIDQKIVLKKKNFD